MKNSLPTKAQRAVELATENEGIIKLADRDSPKRAGLQSEKEGV